MSERWTFADRTGWLTLPLSNFHMQSQLTFCGSYNRHPTHPLSPPMALLYGIYIPAQSPSRLSQRCSTCIAISSAPLSSLWLIWLFVLRFSCRLRMFAGGVGGLDCRYRTGGFHRSVGVLVGLSLVAHLQMGHLLETKLISVVPYLRLIPTVCSVFFQFVILYSKNDVIKTRSDQYF